MIKLVLLWKAENTVRKLIFMNPSFVQLMKLKKKEAPRTNGLMTSHRKVFKTNKEDATITVDTTTINRFI